MTDDLLVPVFDFGGVMFDWNPLYLYRKLFETEEEAVWFTENVCTPDWNIGLDAGNDYKIEVVRKCAEFPRYWREIQAYDTRWKEMNGGIIEGTVAIHDELIAAELPTFAITNFSWEKWASVLPDFPFLEKVRRHRRFGARRSGQTRPAHLQPVLRPLWAGAGKLRVYRRFRGQYPGRRQARLQDGAFHLARTVPHRSDRTGNAAQANGLNGRTERPVRDRV